MKRQCDMNKNIILIEIYDIKFRVHPSVKQINNGDEICVTIHGIDKNIYKIIS